MPDFEDVVKEIHDLTEALRSDRSTIDEDQLAAKFAEQVEALVAKQVQEKIDAQPQRRVPGALIGQDGQPITRSNRYFGMLKGFEQDGFVRVGNQKMKPVDLYLTYLLVERAHALKPDSMAAPSADLQAAVKALTSDAAGAGAEFVPSDLAETLWEDFFLASRVAGAMTTVPMPTNPFEIPLSLGQITWRKGQQRTPTNHSDPATAKSVLTATELVTEQRWSYTMQEDSIGALMPGMRARLAQSGAEVIDDFALNADSTAAATGNINSDDAMPAADSYYLSDGQDGLRHQWLVDNTAQGVDAAGTLTDDHIVSAQAKQGKYAVDPSQNRIVTDVQTYLKGFLSSAAGAPGANLTTIDKFGAGATILTGQIAAYRGMPVILSASHPLTEADGKVSATAANNTKGSLTMFHKMMWYLGFRRQLLIEIDRDIQAREYIMVTSLREAIAAHGTRATNRHTSGVRNILVA